MFFLNDSDSYYRDIIRVLYFQIIRHSHNRCLSILLRNIISYLQELGNSKIWFGFCHGAREIFVNFGRSYAKGPPVTAYRILCICIQTI